MDSIQDLINNGATINQIHNEALFQHFRDGIDQKAFILMSAFPFLFVGKIVDVVNDLVVMDIETTHFAQLENRRWHIHIDSIEVFFIEREDGPTIPELSDC